MKRRLFLLAALAMLCHVTATAQNSENEDNEVILTDTTLFKGKTINIYQDTANAVMLQAGNGAFGNNNNVKGNHSFAFGERCTVTRNYTGIFTVGADNTVSSSWSVALGRYLSLSGTAPSYVIGEGLAADAPLSNTATHCLQVGFLSTKPTLTVTSSPNNYSQNVTNKTGKVGIGDVTPTAKLHIKSDNGEDAGIILEPKQPALRNTFIQMKDSYHKISVGSDGVMQVVAGNHNLNLSGKNYVVSGSRMDLGATTNPRIVLAAQTLPGLYSNANPSQSTYTRYVDAPSYAIRFGTNGLLFRTAEFQPERNEITNWRDALFLGIDSTIVLNGKVGVNTENTTDDYALAVAGGVLANKVFIQSADDWPDYVFDPGYERMPLSELGTYLENNRHLPGVPSAVEMRAIGGVDLAETQTMLLRKIEELTLYTLEQQKLIEELKGRSDRQQRQIDALLAGDTVRFTYDACGNRIGRTIEFSRMDEGGGKGAEDPKKPEKWFAELNDSFLGSDVTLFPNPTEGRFTLAFPNGIPTGAKATLLTLTGTVLSERQSIGPNEEFNLGNQPAGVYLLRLATDEETMTWKIVKRN